MPDYHVGTGERTLGTAAARPWGFPLATLVADSLNSGGAAASRPVGFPWTVLGAIADGSAGILFVKPIYAPSCEGAGGVLLCKAVLLTPVEGAAGTVFSRSAIVTAAEGSAGSVIYRLWIVGEGERSAGILAERPPVRHWLDARGLFRVFNAAEYRFYRSKDAPPPEGSSPFATGDSLPASPIDAFADGTWYLAMSYLNGVLDSGFLPLGPAGETFLTLTISGGEDASAHPPAAPLTCRLAAVGGGAVRITAVYYEDGGNRAAEWAIAYTADGTDPAAGDPDFTAAMPASGLAILTYQLPAAADGATVKVRLQTRRNDGTEAEPNWVYSAAGTAQSLVVDAGGPDAPLAADRWAGQFPVEEG